MKNDVVEAIVEIPYGSKNKYEQDETRGERASKSGICRRICKIKTVKASLKVDIDL